VDQIIGADVDDATLKKYFDENVENFGVATVEANHILIQKMDEKTGCINWEEARKMAEKVIAMIQTGGAKFEALAKKYSEDPATKDKGGDLGLFTLVSRYDYDLCKAIFAMQPGEISSKPVKTKLGYHVIKLRKKTPPDLKKYGFDSKGKKEDVREFRQQRRRDNWLEENIYSKFKLETLLQDILK